MEKLLDYISDEIRVIMNTEVALLIENARVSGQLREAYREVTSSNKAKEKAINHLSHELKTPISVLMASLSFLEKKMKAIKYDIFPM